ncbi:MAG: hypothetical protein HRU36_02745 [Rickettsiales bacterium]|nr:hypothetical protein [Rickettsiales bacterium]
MKRFFILIFVFLISACVTHTAHDKKIYSKLIQISLDDISGKNPYLIRQSFQDEFYINGDDVYKNKKYSLSIKITDSVGGWLIQENSTIVRKSLKMSASFTLRELSTNKVIITDSVKSLIIFSESSSAWSSYISSEKAYKNALRDVMRSIKMKISLSLTQKKRSSKNENNSKQRQKIS